MKQRFSIINPPLPLLHVDENPQQELPKIEAKSHQDSISKGSNPISRDHIELMHVDGISSELMVQSHHENLESKSNVEEDETTSSLNLQSTTTHLELGNQSNEENLEPKLNLEDETTSSPKLQTQRSEKDENDHMETDVFFCSFIFFLF